MEKGKNFYEILGIGFEATKEDIRKSYHKLARFYHPDKNKNVDAEKIFKKVLEAYNVLSDTLKRYAYDQALKAEELARKQRRPQDPDVTHNLPLSLEEIATGCVKLWTFDKQEIQSDGRLATVKKTLQIDIRPGCPTNRKIIFYREGNQFLNRIPANIVFIVQVKPHPVFTRKGHNLLFEVIISLRQALCGTDIQVPTLLGEPQTLCTHGSVIEPGSTRHIRGHGLPYANGSKKGNIVVCFVITFPERLGRITAAALARLLPP